LIIVEWWYGQEYRNRYLDSMVEMDWVVEIGVGKRWVILESWPTVDKGSTHWAVTDNEHHQVDPIHDDE